MDLEQKLSHYRISQDEYSQIKTLLGREPQGVEWALFSSLWSEHCSYKTSKVHLKKFYSKNERVLEGEGENAGVIDLGEGERVAFKMESHNHPSFISPHQGAATGVGGILRDIFTMGARPVALGNYLCFGQPQADKMVTLVDGVVRGIGDYGNCVGVPMLTGQTEFHESYNGNILVNAFALGLFRPADQVFLSKAEGVGNYVVYVGAKTGRDGVHGASMASESFEEDSESKKPTVQIGDPFFEKLLIESCLEVMKENLVVAIQDMGAAGLTSSSFEMASKGQVGLCLHLDKVPVRDSDITPEEILLSESQERMLLICEPEKFSALQKIFHHWDLEAQVIGKVISEKQVQLYWHEEKICDIDPDLLVEKAPRYQRPYDSWQAKNRVKSPGELYQPTIPLEGTFEKVLTSIQGGAKNWIYEQYDQRVGASTVRDCSEPLGVVRLPDSHRALGIVLGCRPHMMRWDAQQGGMDSVVYPALELAIKGFQPLAITDCLNFGNPEKRDLMTEFVASVEGMSSACEALDTPVISGNVSLYNETQNQNVTSTPSTGIVGLRDSVSSMASSHFDEEGMNVYLISSPQVKLSGKIEELLHRPVMKGLGEIDLNKCQRFVQSWRNWAAKESSFSSRIVGRFGLAYTLFRMSHTKSIGVEISSEVLKELSLWGETLYQVVLSVPVSVTKESLMMAFQEWDVKYLGVTIKEKMILGEDVLSITQLKGWYHQSWEKNFATLE